MAIPLLACCAIAINRGHWSIESVHHIIDWNYDEDRSRIRTGFGPENITRLTPEQIYPGPDDGDRSGRCRLIHERCKDIYEHGFRFYVRFER
ncbi:MAG: hypothetical protein Q8O25_00350 [Sulfurisoma sp.]|nr:hypothetical protein [Sulfurisoma sp.]